MNQRMDVSLQLSLLQQRQGWVNFSVRAQSLVKICDVPLSKIIDVKVVFVGEYEIQLWRKLASQNCNH